MISYISKSLYLNAVPVQSVSFLSICSLDKWVKSTTFTFLGSSVDTYCLITPSTFFNLSLNASILQIDLYSAFSNKSILISSSIHKAAPIFTTLFFGEYFKAKYITS